MRQLLAVLSVTLSLSMSTALYAETPQTGRMPEFSNDQVNVWQTIIYPAQSQILKAHRHDFNRVLVAFDSGILKITNDKGKTHFLTLAKDHAYYLLKDIPGELHTDENISQSPIKVMVIEIK